MTSLWFFEVFIILLRFKLSYKLDLALEGLNWTRDQMVLEKIGSVRERREGEWNRNHFKLTEILNWHDN